MANEKTSEELKLKPKTQFHDEGVEGGGDRLFPEWMYLREDPDSRTISAAGRGELVRLGKRVIWVDVENEEEMKWLICQRVNAVKLEKR